MAATAAENNYASLKRLNPLGAQEAKLKPDPVFLNAEEYKKAQEKKSSKAATKPAPSILSTAIQKNNSADFSRLNPDALEMAKKEASNVSLSRLSPPISLDLMQRELSDPVFLKQQEFVSAYEGITPKDIEKLPPAQRQLASVLLTTGVVTDAGLNPIDANRKEEASPHVGSVNSDQLDPVKNQPQEIIKGLIFVPYENFVGLKDVHNIYDIMRDDTGQVVMATGFPNLNEQTIRKITRPYLGQRLDIDTLNSVAEAVKKEVRASTQPFASIYIPEQEVTDGVVVFIIRQAVVQDVQIAGNKAFTTKQIKSEIHQNLGEPVYRDQLEKDLAWLNLHPNRNVSANFEEGTVPNTTRLGLEVQETKPWRVFASRSNDGAASLDKQQYSLGAMHNNLWNEDHKIVYQYGASVDGESMKSHNGFYEFPLPWRHLVSLNASYANAKAPLLDGAFETEGTFKQYGGRYQIPLYSGLTDVEGWGLEDQKLSFGLDYKHSQGNVLFTLFGDPISAGIDSDVEVMDLVTSYEAKLDDPLKGRTDILATLIYSPGDLSSKNSAEDFQTARDGAKEEYIYSRFLLGRTMPVSLPKTNLEPFSLATRIEGQITNDRLIGSERLVGGARPGFRGYTSDAFSGDYGYGASLELTSPSIKIIPEKYNTFGGDFRAGVFTDFGTFKNVDEADSGEDAINYWSTGLSFVFQASDKLSMSLVFSKDLSAQEDDSVQTGMYRLLLSY